MYNTAEIHCYLLVARRLPEGSEYSDCDNGEPEPSNLNRNEDEDEDRDENDGAVAGPKILARVDLGKTVGELL